jgi:phosphonate transport system substrate-binding protein
MHPLLLTRRHACLARLASSAAPTLRAAPRPWTVAVVPQFPAQQIHAAWMPALARLHELSGEPFELVHSPSIDAFEKRFLAGGPDFVFLNPYHMVMAAEAQNYRPLLRDRTGLSGVLVVRRDSPAQQTTDLRGRTLAFPSPNALGASLYMRALLADQGVDFKPSYVKTHANVYRHVLAGEAAAGGGVRATLEAEPEGVRSQLRVLYETPKVAPHPLAAHPRVPDAVSDRVRDLVLGWPEDPADAALLAPMQMPHPVVADHARDYRPLQRLRLSSFVGG